jgi:hypothetical protein
LHIGHKFVRLAINLCVGQKVHFQAI